MRVVTAWRWWPGMVAGTWVGGVVTAGALRGVSSGSSWWLPLRGAPRHSRARCGKHALVPMSGRDRPAPVRLCAAMSAGATCCPHWPALARPPARLPAHPLIACSHKPRRPAICTLRRTCCRRRPAEMPGTTTASRRCLAAPTPPTAPPLAAPPRRAAARRSPPARRRRPASPSPRPRPRSCKRQAPRAAADDAERWPRDCNTCCRAPNACGCCRCRCSSGSWQPQLLLPGSWSRARELWVWLIGRLVAGWQSLAGEVAHRGPHAPSLRTLHQVRRTAEAHCRTARAL